MSGTNTPNQQIFPHPPNQPASNQTAVANSNHLSPFFCERQQRDYLDCIHCVLSCSAMNGIWLPVPKLTIIIIVYCPSQRTTPEMEEVRERTLTKQLLKTRNRKKNNMKKKQDFPSKCALSNPSECRACSAHCMRMELPRTDWEFF